MGEEAAAAPGTVVAKPLASPVLVDTWTETPARDEGARQAAQAALRGFYDTSAWLTAPLEASTEGDAALLRRRLRDLGYLD